MTMVGRVLAMLFQFTPLREGHWLHMTRKTKRIISIHAPPRGATVSNKAPDIR